MMAVLHSGAPVCPDSVSESQHAQPQDSETEAAIRRILWIFVHFLLWNVKKPRDEKSQLYIYVLFSFWDLLRNAWRENIKYTAAPINVIPDQSNW